MPVGAPSREYMEQVVAGMQATIRARQEAAPDPVNIEVALSLFEPIPLLWGSTEYQVRNISYRDGLLLQKLTLRFEGQRKEPVTQEADIEVHERLLNEILALFHSFLDPKPIVNPFEDAGPLEVGALSGFFFACLRTQNHPSRLSAVRLSSSTS